MSGPLALVGGCEWTDGCDFDAGLLAASGASEVVVVATAAAYERPATVVDAARRWFADLGADVVELAAYKRTDASDPAHVETATSARFLYLAGSSAMHLRSVFLGTPLWDAIVAAFEGGAVLAAAGPSAVVLCDAMVDPRGGGFGVGLGLVNCLTLIPHYDRWSPTKVRRTIDLAPRGLALAGIEDRTALIRDADGVWRTAGAGSVNLFLDGKPAPLDQLKD